ncbi:putative RHH DNA-binding protein [Aeropyrum globular virus 1]|uniref:putative RHH DNA-binding protein n=1 Tax=Aeropyrum globular virus 1 TaxID=1932713 RepID=UPI000C7EC00A|nr:putative RHH DNA-binding protein [Aeropyrum globular virus 1]BBC20941.1 putative RHH DNA-binding protein [Aeropyrum globular virus 1]
MIVARACVVNVNNWMPAFLEKLRTDGRIKKWEWAGGSTICFEFDGHIQIDVTDMHDAVPDYVLRNNANYETLKAIFKQYVVLSIINTLRGGVVHGFTDTWIELESTEKTEVVCFRVTRQEKERLEKEAEERGVSLSDYIRSRVLTD